MVQAGGDEAVAVVRDNKETELKVVGKLTPRQVDQLVVAVKTNSVLTALEFKRT